MPSLFDEAEDEEPLPFIVIIIDELADLMMLDRATLRNRSHGWPRWRAPSASI